jgi:KDO2-lipid IV(A) lauroyltransferase
MPELPETARARIAAAHARHLGRSLAEYLSLTARPPALLAREVRIEGLDRVAQARSEGHGIVILTAHFGSWEVAAASMSLALGGLGVIARDLYDIRITRLINRLRSRFKISSYDTADVRGLLRFLKGGGILGVLIDQDSRRVATLPVPFFGHDAATPVGPIRLAERAEASVFMGFIVEEAGGYRLLLEELPDVRTGAEGVLARFNARLESLVRSHPEQWVWMHDRWRSSASVAAT